MPPAQKLRRGSVATLLVFAFAIVLLLLPVGMEGIGQLCDAVLLQRAWQFAEQTVPAAYLCLDSTELAVGHPRLQTIQAGQMIRSRFLETLPPMLDDRLEIVGIDFFEQRIKPDANHWMGADQPLAVPVVNLHLAFTDHRGQRVLLDHAVEMLLD